MPATYVNDLDLGGDNENTVYTLCKKAKLRLAKVCHELDQTVKENRV